MGSTATTATFAAILHTGGLSGPFFLIKDRKTKGERIEDAF